jgi:predicted MFS family arabinose efflux permease
MYIDSRSTSTSRQGVHQLIQLFIGGSANLLGNLLSGYLSDYQRLTGAINFQLLWFVALIGAVLNLLILFFFKEAPVIAAPQPVVPDQPTNPAPE